MKRKKLEADQKAFRVLVLWRLMEAYWLRRRLLLHVLPH